MILNLAGLVLNGAASFLLSPLIVRSLGNEQYGVWALLNAVVGYLWLLDIGIRGAAARFVARAYAKGDQPTANEIVSSAFAGYSAISVAVLVAGLVLSVILDHLVDIPPALLVQARIALGIASLTVVISVFRGAYGGVLAGILRDDLVSLNTLAAAIQRTVLILAVVWLDGGIVGMALAQVASATLSLLRLRGHVRTLYPTLRISPQLANRGALSQLTRFSLVALIIHFSNAIARGLDPLIVARYLGAVQVTYFAVGAALVSLLDPISLSIGTVVSPRLTALQARGDQEGVHTMILRALRLASALIIPASLVLLIRSDSLLTVWMGSEYAKKSSGVLRILTIAFMFSATRRLLQTCFIALGRHADIAPYYVAEVAANAILSVLLIQSFGLSGQAWGTTIPSLLMSLILIPMMTTRGIGIAPGLLIRNALVRPVLGSIPCAVALLLSARMSPHPSFPVLLAQLGLCVPIVVGGIYMFSLEPQERDWMTSLIPGRSHAGLP